MSAHAPALIDVAGLALSADDRRRLKDPTTGGLVLFARNWQDRRQLTELTAEIKSLRPDVLIGVDHEGGRVQRFRSDGFTPLPPMRRLGERWRDGRADGEGALVAMQSATAAGLVIGSELRACGVDLSFAPVLDLDHGPSGVIGDRAIDRDPRVVSVLARCLMQGLLQAGMANCGKHFPGHGFARGDSHRELPVDARPLAELLGDDVLPYRWLIGVLSAVMPAHVVYPAVDARPAGFSARWLQDILRGRLGFGGAVFSDDLSMAGARAGGDAVEAAIAALDAGCDLVLLCNQSMVDGGAPLDAWLDGLARARREGRWAPDEAAEQRRLQLLPQTPPWPWDELMREPRYLQALDQLALLA